MRSPQRAQRSAVHYTAQGVGSECLTATTQPKPSLRKSSTPCCKHWSTNNAQVQEQLPILFGRYGHLKAKELRNNNKLETSFAGRGNIPGATTALRSPSHLWLRVVSLPMDNEAHIRLSVVLRIYRCFAVVPIRHPRAAQSLGHFQLHHEVGVADVVAHGQQMVQRPSGDAVW